MRTLLLACAAALAVTSTAPAQAESRGDQGFTVHRGDFNRGSSDRRHRDRRDRRGVETAVVLDGFGYYDDRYNGRAFAPDSYNDWWHETPSRSFPRWMQNNGGCQRMWWSGGGWTC